MIHSLVNNPLYSVEDRLVIAIGGLKFHEQVNGNLLKQIENLKILASVHYSDSEIDAHQYSHLQDESDVDTLVSSIDNLKNSVFFDNTGELK